MCEFGLRRPEVMLRLLRAFQSSDIGASAPITEEVAVDIEKRFAAGSNIDPGAALVDNAIDEISKRPVGIKPPPMPLPFFRLGFRSDAISHRVTPGKREGTRPVTLTGSDIAMTRWSGPVSQSQSEAVSA